MEILLLILAAMIGGLIGGSIAYVLGKNHGRTDRQAVINITTQIELTGERSRPNFRVVAAPNQKARIIEFPPKTFRFPRS